MSRRTLQSRCSSAAAVRVGCCGFAGAQVACFRDFPVVEVQQTFYEPPAVQTAARWRQRAPADFQFTLKAWQLITHEATSPTYRRLRHSLPAGVADRVGSFRPTADVWSAWRRTWEIAQALHTTVVVFQCPASFTPTPEHVDNLRRFFHRVQAETGSQVCPLPQLAWEPRGDWPESLVHALCEELGLIHVVDPWVCEPVTRGPFYFRLHGIGGYGHRYREEELLELRDRVSRTHTGGWCLFNNVTMRQDAMRFRELLAAYRSRTKTIAPWGGG